MSASHLCLTAKDTAAVERRAAGWTGSASTACVTTSVCGRPGPLPLRSPDRGHSETLLTITTSAILSNSMPAISFKIYTNPCLYNFTCRFRLTVPCLRNCAWWFNLNIPYLCSFACRFKLGDLLRVRNNATFQSCQYIPTSCTQHA